MWDDVRASDLATAIGRANPLSTMREYADDQSVLDLQHTGQCGRRGSWECGEFRLSLSNIGTVIGGHLCVFLSRGASAQARISRGIACVSVSDLGRTVDGACLDQGSSKIPDYVKHDWALYCDHNTGPGMAECELCCLVSCALEHSASLFLWHHS